MLLYFVYLIPISAQDYIPTVVEGNTMRISVPIAGGPGLAQSILIVGNG